MDFCIYPGEVFGLVGESGCGKSTLGKMLANVITPTKGEIIYSGNPITQKNREFKRKIQMVFQDPYSRSR
ncbi:ATP-binding cassette domain-containing protein [Clostridium boliviensis]|uniref:ATP-binding cassette domain-containing protein n=1 Tax=Clostridium boliviensis TaxID=318465 RepID=UPI0034DE8C89